MSYETVKYFTAEDYEIERYRSTVEKVQNAEYQFSLYLEFLKTSQNTLFMICMLHIRSPSATILRGSLHTWWHTCPSYVTH